MSEPLCHLNSNATTFSCGCGCAIERTAANPWEVQFSPCKTHEDDIPALLLVEGMSEVSVHCGCRLERSLIDGREVRMILCARGMSAWRETNPTRSNKIKANEHGRRD